LLVSIALCVKNSGATIRKAVRSVANQDMPHELLEAIAVDDGCSDNTILIMIEELKKTKVPLRILQTGGAGLGKARQMAMDNAKGKYIIWVDGDMELSKDYVRTQVEFMERNPKVAKARGKWMLLENGGLAAQLENMRASEHKPTQTTAKSDVSKLVGIGGSICRLNALRQVGGFDTNITGAGEDIDLAAKLMKAGWALDASGGEFFHKTKETWRDLWRQYLWYGYGSHFVNHKYNGFFPTWVKTPPAALYQGLTHANIAYKATHRKISFLLPFQYCFKNMAWLLGFVSAHLDRYQP